MPLNSNWNDYKLVTNDYLEVIQPDAITLPHRWKGRPYQREIYNVFTDMLVGSNTYKHFLLEWHRRAGKDMTFFQLVVAAASKHIGDYAYCLPLNVQAKKVILNANTRDSDGKPCRFHDFIPSSLLNGVNFSEGIIRLTNGSNIYVMGSDNYDANVGMNLSGVVFSEWSLCDPQAYDYFSPMLEETGRQEKGRGWCLKCWTPRGKNHAWKDRNAAQKESNKNSHYFSSMPLGKSTDFDGSILYTMDDFNRWVEEGKNENILRQEWLLDYDAVLEGLVYQKEIEKVLAENRLCKVDVNPHLPVWTFWDIGVNDQTAIWFMQQGYTKNDQNLYLINYYEHRGEGLEHYVDYIRKFSKQHNVKMGTCVLPHDGKNTEWISGQRRDDKLRELGFEVEVVKRTTDVELAIGSTRQIFSRLVFNEDTVGRGWECLNNYIYKVNKEGMLGSPFHNWASNGADALRQLGQFYEDKYNNSFYDPEVLKNIRKDYDLFEDTEYSGEDWSDDYYIEDSVFEY